MFVGRLLGTVAAIILAISLTQPLPAKEPAMFEFSPEEQATQRAVEEQEAQLTRGLNPRQVIQKPGYFTTKDLAEQPDGLVEVKFVDGLAIRAAGRRLHDNGSGVLRMAPRLASLGHWYPLNDLGDERLKQVREKVMRTSGGADKGSEAILDGEAFAIRWTQAEIGPYIEERRWITRERETKRLLTLCLGPDPLSGPESSS